jgi:hypothetical protein
MSLFLLFRHPGPVSGSIMETALSLGKWMLKQVQHDGEHYA